MNGLEQISRLSLSTYLNVVNRDGKMHPSEAYDNVTTDRVIHDKEQRFPRVVRQFRRAGLDFEIRESVEDRWDASYTQIGDDGEILRDEEGMAIFLTGHEMNNPPEPRYHREYGAFVRQTNEGVAFTQDEWGCVLISANPKYRGMGIGRDVLEFKLADAPLKQTGGFTPSGRATYQSAHDFSVARALGRGLYREAYLQGEMSFAEIREILDQANVVKKYVNQKNISDADFYADKGHTPAPIRPFWQKERKRAEEMPDLNFDRLSDLRVININTSSVLIYNRKFLGLREQFQDADDKEWMLEQCIRGFAHIGGVYHDATPKLFRTYGATPALERFAVEAVLNLDLGESVRVDKVDMHLLGDRLKEAVDDQLIPLSSYHQITLNKPTIPAIDDFLKLSTGELKNSDPYGEHFNVMIEMASALAEEKFEKDIAKQKAIDEALSPSM